MTHVKMTMHEALVEVKINSKRILQTIRDAQFCAANKQSATKINGAVIDDFKAAAKSNYQSICDLIARTNAIKAAISLSNAKTYITVAGKQMSVAEALYALTHGADDKKALLRTLVSQYTSAVEKVESENGEKLDKKVEAFITASFGNKDKTNAEDVVALSDKFRESNSYVLVDPIGIKDQIKALQDEIDAFESSVDSALQISNATTEIEFDY